MSVPAPADHRHAPLTTPLASAPVQVARRTARRARPGNRIAAALTGTFAMPTHPIHGALRRGLLVVAPSEETVRVRAAGRLRRVRVKMSFAPAPAQPARPTAPPAPAGAGLLKAHLDLVDLVDRHAPGGAGVVYDLGEALARLGFVRLAGGGYHPSTVREHLRRLAALAERRIGLEGGAEEPVWRFFVHEAGDTLRPLASEQDWEAARRAGRVVAQAGAWLQACELPHYRMPVGRELLALPMDGHGHQVERVALLLAAELAVWEGAEMRHGPHAVKRGLGSLLARAGVADLAGLRAETAAKGNGPKRLRSYLAGEGFADEGALALLRAHAGFDVDIADEAAFWAAGRGWLERFWDARMRLGLRGFAQVQAPVAEHPLASSQAATGEWPITYWIPRAPAARELGA